MKLSAVYSWRRAFWLKGCDNAEIKARMAGNNRAVMIDGSGTFGNNNRINAKYIGGVDVSFGGERLTRSLTTATILTSAKIRFSRAPL